jgi:hypothetical protein
MLRNVNKDFIKSKYLRDNKGYKALVVTYLNINSVT